MTMTITDLLNQIDEHDTAERVINLLERLGNENDRLSELCDKWNFECDEMREDNKRLDAELQAIKQSEPVGYLMPHYEEMPPIFMWHPLPKGYSAIMGKPLYTTPKPDRTKQLEDALREAKDTIEWMDGCTEPAQDEIDKAIAKIDEVLNEN